MRGLLNFVAWILIITISVFIIEQIGVALNLFPDHKYFGLGLAVGQVPLIMLVSSRKNLFKKKVT